MLVVQRLEYEQSVMRLSVSDMSVWDILSALFYRLQQKKKLVLVFSTPSHPTLGIQNASRLDKLFAQQTAVFEFKLQPSTEWHGSQFKKKS